MAWPMNTVQLLGSMEGSIKIGDINLLKGVNNRCCCLFSSRAPMPEVRADERLFGPFKLGVFQMGEMQRQKKRGVRYYKCNA